MPNVNSNTTQFSTLKFRYPAVKLASGLTTTTTLICSGATNGSLVTDILFRSLDATARNFDIIICATGAQATAENNFVQVIIPANSGNNGSVALASIQNLAPQLFNLDLSGNRIIGLEGSGASGTEWSIYVINKTTLAGDIYIRCNCKDF